MVSMMPKTNILNYPNKELMVCALDNVSDFEHSNRKQWI